MKTRFVLQIGALGFAVSALMFLAIAVMLAPFGFADPIDAILRAQVEPATDIFGQYVAILPAYYVIDNVLIIGWMVGVVGVTALVGKRNQTLGNIVLVLGMAGPILDLLETEISWTLIDVCEPSTGAPIAWYASWHIIRQMSYLIPYSMATLVGIGLWSQKTLDRVTTGVGTIGVVIALMGMYIPALRLAAHSWWLIWLVNLGLLLWRRRNDFGLSE